MKANDIYRFGEGRTGIGQAIEFTCPPGAEEEIRSFLQKKVRTINAPVTHRVNVPHGGYGQYTRYNIIQHRYAGGGSGGCCGFIEILEIKNPPDGRWGIVIHKYSSRDGSVFTEWEAIENAQAAFRGSEESSALGFKRRVVCGALRPWFYAIGDELLVGDYTFPDGLQDDSVFRFGEKFVVFDYEGVWVIKTCMGTRFIEERRENSESTKTECFRLVYWDDGSVWDERRGGKSPRPVEEGEEWITEAIQQFKEMLVGNNAGFTINFSDGNKFVGKLARPKNSFPCAEGRYLVVVHFKDGGSKEGWVEDFAPSKETPDIVQHIIKGFANAKKSRVVNCVEIKKAVVKKGGKKWLGVFFVRS